MILRSFSFADSFGSPAGASSAAAFVITMASVSSASIPYRSFIIFFSSSRSETAFSFSRTVWRFFRSRLRHHYGFRLFRIDPVPFFHHLLQLFKVGNGLLILKDCQALLLPLLRLGAQFQPSQDFRVRVVDFLRYFGRYVNLALVFLYLAYHLHVVAGFYAVEDREVGE